jgi:hypothetical protein
LLLIVSIEDEINTGLPDDIFSNKKIPNCVNFGESFNGSWWYILSHLVYFTFIRYILWPFGAFYVSLLFTIWCVVPRKKSGNPD